MSVRHVVEMPVEEGQTASPRNVYVIDDNIDVRKSLHFALQPTGIVVWPFGTPDDFLDALDQLAPAPILLDIRMPKINGIELLRIIRERSVEWPVIMMTAHGDVPVAVEAMKLGALDFLEKPFDMERLEDLLTDAFIKCAVGVVTSEQRRNAIEALATLSGREKQVAIALGMGRRNKEIALDLGISPRTVEIHRASALKKLNVRTTADAVRLLIEAGEA
jgi:two-component system response regulator FixJ